MGNSNRFQDSDVLILATPPVMATEEEWREELKRVIPDVDISFMYDDNWEAGEVDILLIGDPAVENLPPLPNLKLIIVIYAGVDGVLSRQNLPDVPIVRAQAQTGDPAMTEYVLLHVLRHHRQLPQYALQQMEHRWNRLPQKRPYERTVGFMGYGTLARPCVDILHSMGFDVAAWVRSEPRDAEIRLYYGRGELEPFLNRTEIVVCLLPLTGETRHLLCARTFRMLPHGAAVINVGRGAHLVTEDLIASLDSGQLAAATLDVTESEPLPPESPLWSHRRVTILPHVARAPGVGLSRLVPQIAENIRRIQTGESLIGLVNRATGY